MNFAFARIAGSIYRRGARRWRKLYLVNGHIFQAKRFNRVSHTQYYLLSRKLLTIIQRLNTLNILVASFEMMSDIDLCFSSMHSFYLASIERKDQITSLEKRACSICEQQITQYLKYTCSQTKLNNSTVKFYFLILQLYAFIC